MYHTGTDFSIHNGEGPGTPISTRPYPLISGPRPCRRSLPHSLSTTLGTLRGYRNLSDMEGPTKRRTPKGLGTEFPTKFRLRTETVRNFSLG